MMKRLYVLCEGQTEETFVSSVLSLALPDTSVITTLIGKHGGISTWGKVEKDLQRLLADSNARVTMMIDFYQLPKDAPGFDAIAKNPKKPTNAAQHIQNCIAEHLGNQRLIPFLMVHEFEALLFCNPEVIGSYFDSPQLAKELEQIKNGHESPEHINGGKDTNPAGRLNGLLQKHLPHGYAKRSHGPTLADRIGLKCMSAECPHFADWLDRLRGI